MQRPDSASGELRLHQWQSLLQASILDPEQDRAALRIWLHTGPVDTDSQLEIYANAYAMRLVEALRCNYPAVHRALGDEEFDVMGKRYLDLHPSKHPSIRWFGARLANFLQHQEPYAQAPVLADLASFEWAVRHTIDAADAECVTAEFLKSVPADGWGDLRFDLHPSVSLLALQWNAPQLCSALTDETASPDGSNVQPIRQVMHWLVYRKPNLASGWHSLSDLQSAALEAIRRGATFADVCEHFAGEDDQDAALQAAGLLRLGVELGVLVHRESCLQAAAGQ
ncbi:MAG: DNA-binding domain-containing protein [Lysobacterales bacterium]|jgi:hypothetical protein